MQYCVKKIKAVFENIKKTRDEEEKLILDRIEPEILAELYPTRSHNFSDESSTNYYKYLQNKIIDNIKAQICDHKNFQMKI